MFWKPLLDALWTEMARVEPEKDQQAPSIFHYDVQAVCRLALATVPRLLTFDLPLVTSGFFDFSKIASKIPPVSDCFFEFTSLLSSDQMSTFQQGVRCATHTRSEVLSESLPCHRRSGSLLTSLRASWRSQIPHSESNQYLGRPYHPSSWSICTPYGSPYCRHGRRRGCLQGRIRFSQSTPQTSCIVLWCKIRAWFRRLIPKSRVSSDRTSEQLLKLLKEVICPLSLEFTFA